MEGFSWEDQLKVIKDFYQMHGHIFIPDNYIVNGEDFGQWFYSFRINPRSISLEKKLELEKMGMVWNKYEYKWFLKYYEAKAYYEEHGNINVSTKHILYHWFFEQRQYKNKNKLSQVKIDLLDKIGMVWINNYEDRWAKNYKALKDYYLKHGDCNVPKDYIANGINLFTWVTYQKTNKETLKEEQIKLLNDISFSWARHSTNWDTAYAIAEQYYKDNGDLLVPKGYMVGDFDLNAWIIERRRKYNKNELSAEKVELLNAIGMVWNIRDHKWLEFYKLAKEYYKIHGNLHVSNACKFKKRSLGGWIITQRDNYEAGKLSEEKIKLLNEIEMVWDKDKIFPSRNELNWEKNYKLAKEYYETHGDLLVHRKYVVAGVKLGVWIGSLRTNKDTLTQEQIDRLDAIGMQWTLLDKKKKTWEESYEIAKRYHEEHGNLIVEADVLYEDYNLYVWIQKQKYNYAQGKLAKRKIQLLDEIDMVWNAKTKLRLETWNENYKLAKAYYKTNGNLIDISDEIVDKWIKTQRALYSRDLLSKTQINRLNSIGMVWNLREYQWMETYNELKAEYEQKGYIVQIGSIIRWIKYQKQQQREGKLSAEKISLLEAIGIKLLPIDIRWFQKYTAVVEYCKKNGNIIEVDDPELSGWLNAQRKNYEINKLNSEQIKLLNKLGMVWDLKKYKDYQNKFTKYNLLLNIIY